MARTKSVPSSVEGVFSKWEELHLDGCDATTVFIKAVWAQMILHGMGIQRLAESTGIPYTTVSRTLNRRGGSPSLETADKYAGAFGMTIRQLLASVDKLTKNG